MSVETFKATHCGETFAGAEGAKALEAHMRQAHDRKMIVPGSNVNGEETDGWGRKVGTAPGWRNGRILEPTPWVAPKRTPGGIAKVTEKIAAGAYYWAVGHMFPAGVRWSTANVAGEVITEEPAA